jgi:hypothetical protein
MREAAQRQLLTADWAWISKIPGSGDDYAIIGASAGVIDVRSFAWQFVAGVPSGAVPLDSPGAPPWVTFGAHPASTGPVVSVSMQLPPEEDALDQAGRPIWPRFFCASHYKDARVVGASFQTLVAAMMAMELDASDPSPIALGIRTQPLDDRSGLIAAVNEFGVNRMAAIAAALLDDRQVAVTGTSGMLLPERLRLLDAAVALLPYGFRAVLTASSAVDRKITHQIRLVLTDFPDEHTQVVVDRWGSRPPEPQPGVALDYLRKLMDRIGTSGLEAVIEHLWNAREACSFSHPRQALEILERLHHDRYLIMRIRKEDEQVTLEDALDFLDGEDTRVAERWAAERSHDPGTVYKLLATLLAAESPAAADAVIRHWRVIADDLVTYLNAELNRGNLDPSRQALAIVARQDNQQRVDSLLKRLLIPVNTGKPYDDPIRYRVALLRERRVPAPGALPSTCDALRYDDYAKWQAQFVYALLAEEHAYEPAGSRAVEWARWLCASRFQGRWECPQWVRALSLAVPGAAEIESEDSVRTVLELASDWVPAILRVAGFFDRLPRVVGIPGFDAGLVELGQRLASAADSDPASADRARQVAVALRVPLRGTGLDPGTIALIDVTRALLGDAPADFPHGDASDFDVYLVGLDRGLGLLAGSGWDAGVAHRILAYVVPPDATPVAGFPVAERLIGAWSKGARVGMVARHVAGLLDHDHILSDILSDDAAQDNAGTGQGGADRGIGGALVSGLSSAAWSRLMEHDERLLPVGSMKQLQATIKAGVQDPALAFRRRTFKLADREPGLPAGGVMSSALAFAMYEALYAGISTWGILTVIRAELEQAPPARRLTPATLRRVLLEFQDLICYHVPAEGPEPSMDETEKLAAYAELVWLRCLEDISVRQALGPEFARAFTVGNTQATRDGRASYNLQGKILPENPGPLRMRTRAAERTAREWQQRLRAEIRGLDPRLLPPQAGRPDPGGPRGSHARPR